MQLLLVRVVGLLPIATTKTSVDAVGMKVVVVFADVFVVVCLGDEDDYYYDYYYDYGSSSVARSCSFVGVVVVGEPQVVVVAWDATRAVEVEIVQNDEHCRRPSPLFPFDIPSLNAAHEGEGVA